MAVQHLVLRHLGRLFFLSIKLIFNLLREMNQPSRVYHTRAAMSLDSIHLHCRLVRIPGMKHTCRVMSVCALLGNIPALAHRLHPKR